MKKISFILALVMVFSVSLTALANNWVDGTYEAWSDAGRTSIKYAKVFIDGGQITGVILREFTNKHIEKDWATYRWEQAKEAAQTMPIQFVQNQAAKADIVTGATGSSTGYIQAVERALVKADPTVKTGKYFDGTFLGRSEAGARGYYEVVWVTIANDKITDIQFQRVLANMDFLDPAEYNFPLEAARETYKELAIAGNTANVDTITGATGSTGMWNRAVQDALDKALVR